MGGTRVINSPLLSPPLPSFPGGEKRGNYGEGKKRRKSAANSPGKKRLQTMFIGIVFPSFFFSVFRAFSFFPLLFLPPIFACCKKRETRGKPWQLSFAARKCGESRHSAIPKILPLASFPFFLFLVPYRLRSVQWDPPFQKKRKKAISCTTFQLPGKSARKSPFFPPRHGIREMWISSPGAISPQIKGEFPPPLFFSYYICTPGPRKKDPGRESESRRRNLIFGTKKACLKD